jgi:hypothetical protein
MCVSSEPQSFNRRGAIEWAPRAQDTFSIEQITMKLAPIYGSRRSAGRAPRLGGIAIVKLATLVTVGLAGVILGVWLQSNLRPAPSVADAPVAALSAPVTVSDTRLIEPNRDGDPYRLETTLRRDGPAGVVNITFRLRNRATGDRVERTSPVELQPGQALVVVAELPAPRADYAPEVEVSGPAR